MPQDAVTGNCVDECARVDLPDRSGDALDIGTCDHRVDNIAPLLFVTALRCPDRGTVMAGFIDCVLDFIPPVRNDKQGLLPVVAVQKTQGLRGSVLENNGIQGFVPSKEIACGKQDDRIESQDQVKAVHASFLGEENGDQLKLMNNYSNSTQVGINWLG